MAVRDTPPDTDDDSRTTANGQTQAPSDWSSIFDAPDFTNLVRPAQSRKAKEYSDKVKSVLKSGMVGAINLGDFPDAAAILSFGPAFADASGQLADADKNAAKMIDVITAPGNPYVMFVMTGIPLIAQLFRNHEQAIMQLPETRRQARLRRKAETDARKTEKPRFTIRVLGREYPIRFRTPKISKVLAGLSASTRDPNMLTASVFTDQRVIKALAKQGIILRPADESPDTQH